MRLLLSKPLREITDEELTGYASSVFYTVGDQEDFQYFLPRILELSVTQWHWWPDVEVVLTKLRLAEWRAWPESKIDAVMKFLHAAFDEAIDTASNEANVEVDSWICGVALAGVDVQPFLEKLEAPSSGRALRRFVQWNDAYRTHGAMTNPFWDGDRAAASGVADWLNSPRAQAAIQLAEARGTGDQP